MNYYITLLLVLGLGQAYAQLDSYSYVDEGAMIKFEPRYIYINTLEVSPDSVQNPKGFTIRLLSLDHVTFDQGGYQDSHRFPFITEAFSSMVIEVIKGGDFEAFFKNSSTEIGSFIIGWHNHMINAVSIENFNVALGGHLGDYFLSYEPYGGAKGSYGTAREPGGWYGALGPAVMIDYNLMNMVNLHFEGSYAFTLKFMDAVDMDFDRDYPKPHFLNFSLQLRTDSPFYGGFEHVRSLNRGDHPFNATRSDIFLGFWL